MYGLPVFPLAALKELVVSTYRARYSIPDTVDVDLVEIAPHEGAAHQFAIRPDWPPQHADHVKAFVYEDGATVGVCFLIPRLESAN